MVPRPRRTILTNPSPEVFTPAAARSGAFIVQPEKKDPDYDTARFNSLRVKK
jgi:hypothetical protein